MDTTKFALALINAYKAEHNKMRRAQYQISKIYDDKEWVSDMKKKDFNISVFTRGIALRAFDLKQAKRYFKNLSGSERIIAFTSNPVKVAYIESYKTRNFNRLYDNNSPDSYVIFKAKETLKELEATPVEAELGKKWRKLVMASQQYEVAKEARWQARCAIKFFNKMNTGIEIKFGNCRKDGGSMSYISHVVVDGFKMKLSKFLDNAAFEQAVLNG